MRLCTETNKSFVFHLIFHIVFAECSVLTTFQFSSEKNFRMANWMFSEINFQSVKRSQIRKVLSALEKTSRNVLVSFKPFRFEKTFFH